METSDIASWVGEHLPETLLLIGGLLAIAIVACYVKDKDSTPEKAVFNKTVSLKDSYRPE